MNSKTHYKLVDHSCLFTVRIWQHTKKSLTDPTCIEVLHTSIWNNLVSITKETHRNLSEELRTTQKDF